MFTAPATPLMEFQSTPPARGGDAGVLICQWHNSISIHAPREGGDTQMWMVQFAPMYISIHAPREGGDAL